MPDPNVDHSTNPFGLGLGVIGPKAPSPTDYKLAHLSTLASAEPFDWAAGSGTPEPPQEDQDGSGSCTQQMLGYMFFTLTGVQLSRQDGYSRTHGSSGGAYMWQPFDNIRKSGQYTRDQGFPEPSPEGEQAMITEIVSDINRKLWEVTYWQLTDLSIEGIARAIKQYKVVGGAVNVQWGTWGDITHPQPPDPNKTIDGSHALCWYNYGFDTEPFLVAKGSWGTIAPNHIFRTNYFTSHEAFDFYVMTVKEYTPMPSNGFVQLINNKGKIGVIEYIDTPENLTYQGKLHGLDVPVFKNPDGTPKIGPDGHIMIDWANLKVDITL